MVIRAEGLKLLGCAITALERAQDGMELQADLSTKLEQAKQNMSDVLDSLFCYVEERAS